LINRAFWKDKKVFITGHTGFKGAWLSLFLYSLGAKISGYALNPPTEPSLYELCKINRFVNSKIADIRDGKLLINAMLDEAPEIVIHMAAQSLVRVSYSNPVETYEVNVMGTVNLFEAVRNCKTVKAVINVTSDKCYENREWCWGYREDEPMGGYDPYSNSKACSELVTSSYRRSFFNEKDHCAAVASVRAGNVIGGGDWAADRLIPDCLRALLKGEKIIVRNPKSIRPWQHAVEPLSGYLMVLQKLYEEGPLFAEAWNFGPNDDDTKSVEWIVKAICKKWGHGADYVISSSEQPHEAGYLKLDCSKAKSRLEWHPRWNIEKAIDKIIEWTQAYKEKKDLTDVCLRQIGEYLNSNK